MTHVLVTKHALSGLLREMVDLRSACGGEVDGPQGFGIYLDPRDEVVTLAVEAGLLIPGHMQPGTVPPAPPQQRFEGGTPVALCYRDALGKLRCSIDAKVVYGNKMQAGKAAADIGKRQRMKVYQGHCGHWHLATVKDGK